MATKNLLVRGGADFSGMKKALQKAQNDIKNFKENVSNSMKGIGAALASIGAGLYIKEATKDAAAFEAKMTTLSESLGNSIRDFQKWQETVGRSLGYSKLQSAELANTLSLNFKQFATSQQDLLDKTTKMMEVAALVANKRGMAMSEVSDRIRSAMNQEADGADELGVNVRVSAIQQSKAYQMMANGAPWEQLTTNMQKAILYHHILEQVSTNLGTTIQDTTSMRISVFTAALGDLRLALGQAFLPILHTVLPVLTAFINKLTSVISVVAQFTQALFGKSTAQQQATAINQQANAVSGLSDSYKQAGKEVKKTGKEAKKASGFLAGFDEINQVGKKDAGSSGSGDDPTGGAAAGGLMGTGAMPLNFETNAAEIGAKVKAMADKIKGFFSNVKSLIIEHKDVIIAALAGITAGLLAYALMAKRATVATTIFTAATTVLTKLRTALIAFWAALTGPIGLIAIAIGAVVAAFVYFYRTNEKFRGFVDGILLSIKDAAVSLWENGLVPLGEYLKDALVKAWELAGKAGEWFWKNVLVPLGNFVIWLWKNVIEPVAKILADGLSIAFNTVAKVAESFWKNVMVPLGQFLKSTFTPTIEAISAVLKFLWENVMVPMSKFVGGGFKAVFEALVKVLTFLWQNVMKPLTDYMNGSFLSVFNTVFKGIGDLIKGLQTTFIGLMTFIKGVFTGDWREAWNGVKQIFKGIFDSLWAIVKTPLNLIIDGINTVIGGLNKIKFKTPDWMPGGSKSFGINIGKIPKLAKGGITNGPTLAMIGDNPGGKEVVSPLDDLVNMIGSAVKNANNNASTGDIVIKVGETEFGRIAAKSINKAQRVSGKLLLDI